MGVQQRQLQLCNCPGPVFIETLRKCGKGTIRGCCVIDFWAQGPFLLAWKVWQVLFKELMNVNGHIICKS